MTLRFDHPELLFLALLALPVAIIGWRSLRSMDGLRRSTILILRTIVIAALAIVLAGPHVRREHNQVTVIGLLDVSGSVRRFAKLPEIPDLEIRTNLEYLRHWCREATQTRAPDDRFGLIVFDGRAMAVSTPTRGEYNDEHLDLTILEGTNIAEAIQLGLAMFPADTARRLVLITDGNETVGSALAAAREAAGRTRSELETVRIDRAVGVPIDVVPIAYRVEQDVQVARIDVPPTARPGQVVTVRIVLEAIRPANGYLTLMHEEAPVDLNGESPGFRRALRLPAGESVHTVEVEMLPTPVNRFEAFFELADAAEDQLPENNRREAFIATPSRGSVLIARIEGDSITSPLEETLRANEIPVVAVTPGRIPADLLQLQAYDLVVLENVPAYDVPEAVQQLLARYVNDFGGGLIMIGGENGFGAGGWNGTPVEDVLPVELDLPRELRLTDAALVLVLDKSGSMGMNVAGTRATQQEIANHGTAAAIESLQRDSLIGVVVFDSFPQVRVPLGPNDDPQENIRRVMGIMPGGGTYMVPALRRAHDMLRETDARRKYVVILSDGRSDGQDDIRAIATQMAGEGIEISSIAVGDAADHALLEEIATIGGGEFYPVINPATLPRFLVDSVQVVNKPLLKEVPFTPVIEPSGTSLTAGMSSAPQLGGIVLTAHREDPRVVTELTTPDGEPLLAHWQAGLGRAAAFTSDAGHNWAQRWIGWPGYAPFWTQLARLISRPPMSQEYELTTTIIDGRLNINLEALDVESGFLDYLVVEGTVYSPRGEAIPVRLHQFAPGGYTGAVDARESGSYIVALTPKRGNRALTPVIGGATQPGGAEFRRYRSNVALLQRISEETGGRLLELEQPRAVNLYDRSGMPRSVSILPAWRTFLWWLLALMLIDVAARRIAWDRGTFVRAWLALRQKMLWPQRRETPAAVTLASLRQRNIELEETIAREGAAFEKLRGDTRLRLPETGREGETTSPESRRKQIRRAIAKLTGEGKGEADEPVASPVTKPPSKEEDSGETDESDESRTTSGLLAAKRRLRQRFERD